MKMILIFLLTLSTSLNLHAKCFYTLKHEALLFQGYTINFGPYLENAMVKKGYERTFETTNLEVVPSFNLSQEGHFEIAKAGFDLKDNENNQIQTQVLVSKRCYTQSCGVSDARNVLVNSIQEFARIAPRCPN